MKNSTDAMTINDTEIQAWISVSLIVIASVLFFNDRLTLAMSNWLLILYLLFSLVVACRWGVVLTKVIDLLRTLREQGQSFTSPQISLLLGLASIAILFIGSAVNARLILVSHGRVRVI